MVKRNLLFNSLMIGAFVMSSGYTINDASAGILVCLGNADYVEQRCINGCRQLRALPYAINPYGPSIDAAIYASGMETKCEEACSAAHDKDVKDCWNEWDDYVPPSY